MKKSDNTWMKYEYSLNFFFFIDKKNFLFFIIFLFFFTRNQLIQLENRYSEEPTLFWYFNTII